MMVIEIYPSKRATALAVASHVGDLLDVDELRSKNKAIFAPSSCSLYAITPRGVSVR